MSFIQKAVKVLKQSLWQFPSDLNVLDQVLTSFDQLVQPFIPKPVWLQCQLALAEAFTNAVRHAHKDYPPDVTVDIEVTLFAEHLEMRIWDRGANFDLEQLIEEKTKMVDEDIEGGRGLPILHQVADKLSYRRTDDNRNCLLLVKHYSDASLLES